MDEEERKQAVREDFIVDIAEAVASPVETAEEASLLAKPPVPSKESPMEVVTHA